MTTPDPEEKVRARQELRRSGAAGLHMNVRARSTEQQDAIQDSLESYGMDDPEQAL